MPLVFVASCRSTGIEPLDILSFLPFPRFGLSLRVDHLPVTVLHTSHPVSFINLSSIPKKKIKKNPKKTTIKKDKKKLFSYQLKVPYPSLVSSLYCPSYLFPSGQVNTPCPCLSPFLNSPSYLVPSGHV